MVVSIIISLMTLKAWLSRALRLRLEVHPLPEVNNNEQINMTSDEDGSNEMVNIAVHTVTFYGIFLFILLSNIICSLVGLDCKDSSIRLIFPLVNTALLPAIWVLAKREIRNHAWRQFKGWFQFGYEI